MGFGIKLQAKNDGNLQKCKKIMENTRKWSRRVVKESKGEAKGAKRDQTEAKVSQREPKGSQKGAKREPK